MPTLGELLDDAAIQLRSVGIESPRLDAELLVADVLGLERIQVHTQSERPLALHELGRCREVLGRRMKFEPVAYILGRAPFRNLVLDVDRRVLIPRPETELLVEIALAHIAERNEPSTVLDVGTGSGAIAVAIAIEAAGKALLTATDISMQALSVARNNGARCGAMVEFLKGPVFEPVSRRRFDIIVSNPPYIGRDEADRLMPDVRDHEPDVALFAPEQGQAVVRQIIEGAPSHLEHGGLIAIEVGAGQAQDVVAMFDAAGFSQVDSHPDLQGIDRVISGRWR